MQRNQYLNLDLLNMAGFAIRERVVFWRVVNFMVKNLSKFTIIYKFISMRWSILIVSICSKLCIQTFYFYIYLYDLNCLYLNGLYL